MEYPNYKVHWKTGHGELREEVVVCTPITGITAATRHIKLEPSGRLTLRKGYIWDFGSGPAIDTPAMVYASLTHDAFYELMQLKKLTWIKRKEIDSFFKSQLKRTNMGWFRRQWVYLGVRYGQPLLKIIKGLLHARNNT